MLRVVANEIGLANTGLYAAHIRKGCSQFFITLNRPPSSYQLFGGWESRLCQPILRSDRIETFNKANQFGMDRRLCRLTLLRVRVRD